MTSDDIDDVATLRRAAKLPEAENQKMARMSAKLKKQLHDLHLADEGDQVCKACGGRLTEWSGQYEESEEIDVLERRFVLKRHKHQKYRCSCGACIETAPGPFKLFDGAR